MKIDWDKFIADIERMLDKEEVHWLYIYNSDLPPDVKRLFLSKSEAFTAHLSERIKEYKKYAGTAKKQ